MGDFHEKDNDCRRWKIIREELYYLLSNSNYEPILINDFKNSKEEIIDSNADLILLDINIPY